MMCPNIRSANSLARIGEHVLPTGEQIDPRRAVGVHGVVGGIVGCGDAPLGVHDASTLRHSPH